MITRIPHGHLPVCFCEREVAKQGAGRREGDEKTEKCCGLICLEDNTIEKRVRILRLLLGQENTLALAVTPLLTL